MRNGNRGAKLHVPVRYFCLGVRPVAGKPGQLGDGRLRELLLDKCFGRPVATA